MEEGASELADAPTAETQSCQFLRSCGYERLRGNDREALDFALPRSVEPDNPQPGQSSAGLFRVHPVVLEAKLNEAMSAEADPVYVVSTYTEFFHWRKSQVREGHYHNIPNEWFVTGLEALPPSTRFVVLPTADPRAVAAVLAKGFNPKFETQATMSRLKEVERWKAKLDRLEEDRCGRKTPRDAGKARAREPP